VSGPGGASAVRLSKIDDYLADKFCVLMLSEVVGWVQGKIELAVDRFPIWESPGGPAKGPSLRKERDRLGHPPGVRVDFMRLSAPMSFDGIHEKLKRADGNIVNLQAEVSRFFQECEYPVMPKVQDKEHTKALAYYKSMKIPLRFSVLSGEIVHHLRSCLDHIIWELSDEPTRSSKDGIYLEFPILDTRPTPETEGSRYSRKVKGVTSVAALKIIGELQPYNRIPADSDPLWIIHKMDIADKHRELVITQPSGHIEAPFDIVRNVYRHLLLKQRLSTNSIRDLDQYGRITPQISFRDFSGRIAEPIVPKLEQLTRHVQEVVERFEKIIV